MLSLVPRHKKAKLSKPLITNSVSSEDNLADTFLSRIFSDGNNGYSDVSMTQSSENVCENLEVDKEDLNGQVNLTKVNFLLILLRIMTLMKLHMTFKFSLVRI